MTGPDYDHLLDFLPQRRSLRLVDEIIHVDGNSAETASILNEQRCRLFGNGSSVDAVLGVELLAQSAVFSIAVKLESSPTEGMIVQVQTFEAHPLKVDSGHRLQTHCSVELARDNSMAIVQGRVFREGELICEGKLLLALDNGE